MPILVSAAEIYISKQHTPVRVNAISGGRVALLLQVAFVPGQGAQPEVFLVGE